MKYFFAILLAFSVAQPTHCMNETLPKKPKTMRQKRLLQKQKRLLEERTQLARDFEWACDINDRMTNLIITPLILAGITTVSVYEKQNDVMSAALTTMLVPTTALCFKQWKILNEQRNRLLKNQPSKKHASGR